MQPANAVAKLLIDRMMNTDDYFTLTGDDEVGVVINNLGGTSNLELAVMANDTIRYLGMLAVFVINWDHILYGWKI